MWDCKRRTASGGVGFETPLTGDLDPLLVPAPEALLTAARQSAQGLSVAAGSDA